jgi:hypothetical protein
MKFDLQKKIKKNLVSNFFLNKLKRNELDGLDSPDKYPDSFHVVLNMELKTNQSPLASEEPWNYYNDFETLMSQQNQPLLFSSNEEMNQLLHIFGIV